MLFEMLTGAQPHTGDTPLAVAYKHVNAVVPAPSSLVADLPAALDALVALGTSRDPDLRPADARQYLQAIAQVRRGMPLAQPPGRRGAHAAPDADHAGPPAQQAGNAQTFSSAATGRIASRGPANGTQDLAAYNGHADSTGRLQPQANHTMIVPAGGDDHDYGDGGPYSRRPRRSRGYREPFLQRWLFSKRIIIVLAIILVAGLGWWLASGRYVSVPSVARMAVSTARGELTSADLSVVIGRAQHSDTVPRGDVISISPRSGSRLPHGGKVTLIPSLGPVLISMPNVTGQQVAQAEQALKVAGLSAFKVTSEPSSTIQPGLVVATTPVAYTSWPENKPVQLVVSSGPPLPSFVGEQLSQAQAQAQQLGISLNPTMVANSTQAANTILGETPAAGTPITAGEVVNVNVSQGPPNVAVPNVQGMNYHQAVRALTAAGFTVTVQGGGFGGNTVTSYSPTGPAPEGSAITIVLGLGF
jgi:serine/threonine-protein kinase